MSLLFTTRRTQPSMSSGATALQLMPCSRMASTGVLTRVYKHTLCVCRADQSHVYTVYVRFFWQGHHQIYGHIRRIYTVLANPRHIRCIYGLFGRDITKYTVIYGVYIRLWPTYIYTYMLSKQAPVPSFYNKCELSDR